MLKVLRMNCAKCGQVGCPVGVEDYRWVAASVVAVEGNRVLGPGVAAVEGDVGVRQYRIVDFPVSTHRALIVVSAADHVQRIGWVDRDGRLVVKKSFAVGVDVEKRPPAREISVLQ